MAPSSLFPDLTTGQTLLIFKLLFTGEEPKKSDARPKLSVRQRNQLEQAGFIVLEKRKGPTGHRADHIVLTDKAWRWANDHLDAPFTKRPDNPARALAGLLRYLKRYMETRQVALADILVPPEEAPTPAPPPETPPPGPSSESFSSLSMEQRVIDACLALAGGVRKTRVRLAALRERLADIERDALDQTLIQMQREERLMLYRLDDPTEIGPADQAAALVLGAQPRHILYLGD